jgi:hypothetical protein
VLAVREPVSTLGTAVSDGGSLGVFKCNIASTGPVEERAAYGKGTLAIEKGTGAVRSAVSFSRVTQRTEATKRAWERRGVFRANSYHSRN